MIHQIKGKLEKNETQYIDIEWCWEYQGNDVRDTLEGVIASNYSLEMSLITENIL